MRPCANPEARFSINEAPFRINNGMIQTATKVPVFEIIQLDCAAQVETVIGRARSRAEADRVVAVGSGLVPDQTACRRLVRRRAARVFLRDTELERAKR